MAMIAQDGFEWRDNVPGCWSSLAKCNGIKFRAYAIIIETVDGEQRAVHDEASGMMMGLNEMCSLLDPPWPTYRIGDDDCVIVMVPDVANQDR